MGKQSKFGYGVNRRRMWKKSKKMPTITCKPLQEAWDPRKSLNKNLADMGLSANPNKSIPIPTMKDKLKPRPLNEAKTKSTTTKCEPPKVFVLQALEDMANVPPGRTIQLSEPLLNYCINMIEKYGEDYKAMARDPRNYYQDTPKQIRKKINFFKNIPEQYKPYIQGKKSGQDDGDKSTAAR